MKTAGRHTVSKNFIMEGNPHRDAVFGLIGRRFRSHLRTSCMALALTLLGCIGARAEPYVGQIMITGSNFCPRGWVEANGQLVAISSNEVLFSLFGTTYGGDGQTTFGLPDLRGRVAIHNGQGPGLSPREIGSVEGTDAVVSARGNTDTVAGPPSLALMYCIATQGIYPSRN